MPYTFVNRTRYGAAALAYAEQTSKQAELKDEQAKLNAEKQQVNFQKQQLDRAISRQNKIVSAEARRQAEEILDNKGIQLPNNLLNEQMTAHRATERTIDNDNKSKNNVTQQRL